MQCNRLYGKLNCRAADANGCYDFYYRSNTVMLRRGGRFPIPEALSPARWYTYNTVGLYYYDTLLFIASQKQLAAAWHFFDALLGEE